MMATIKEFPNELLMKIFSHYILSEGHMAFLRNIPRVCKRWNELSSDSSLWKDVRAYDWNFLKDISRRGLLENTQSLKVDYDEENFSDMNLSAVLKNIRDLKTIDLKSVRGSSNVVMLLAKYCPHLEYLYLKILNPRFEALYEWDHFLTECGPTLKSLELLCWWMQFANQEQMLSEITVKCPLLERLCFFLGFSRFPLHKLQSGCPKLRELEFSFCYPTTTAGRDDSLCCGFKDLKKFIAIHSGFSDFGIYSVLKNSMDLEHLELRDNSDLVFGNILKIPSNKVRVLKIKLKESDENLKTLGDAVWKWRRTLSILDLGKWEHDISCVFERLLDDNPNPQLMSLSIGKNINAHFIEKFIQKCRNLIHLEINGEEYKGREKIKEVLELLVRGENCA